MKIYAYVKSETCVSREAVRPGSFVGRNEEHVHLHGDYNAWPHGKRATMAIAFDPFPIAANAYRRQCARLVIDLLDWGTR